MPQTATGARRIYRVTASKTVEFLVAARTLKEAREFASADARDAMDDADFYIESVHECDTLDVGEDDDEIPYGDNEDYLTVREILDENEGALPVDETVTPVHWCHGCSRQRVPFDWRKEVQLCDACEELVA